MRYVLFAFLLSGCALVENSVTIHQRTILDEGSQKSDTFSKFKDSDEDAETTTLKAEVHEL